MKTVCTLFLIALVSCSPQGESFRTRIDLQGQWQFAMDTANVGVKQKWYQSDLGETVMLPGTTDTNKKGFLNHDTTTMHLNRVYKYRGAAWYRKKISIPDHFSGKHIELVLERCKSSKVWIDSTPVGESHLLQSPQKFELSEYLTPGEHDLTILVNNDLKLTPFGNVHIYSDDTQTNWNGILGKIYIEASPEIHISNLQVYPDVENQKFDVELEIENPLNIDQVEIELQLEKSLRGKTTKLRSLKSKFSSQPKIKLEYTFDEEISYWDEFSPALYHLTAVISGPSFKDAKKVDFGMRSFQVDGTQFSINGRRTFLRGKHEAAVFPITGYTPMNVEDWSRVYRIAKTYGINHYRFHSYCPPEAAFIAADREGIYLQAELPFWGGLESDAVAEMLRNEGLAMMRTYANHPSFVLFSPGNEIWAGHEKVEEFMVELKAYDHRPLYAMGSNNNIGYLEPREYCDFFIGARIPEKGESITGHTRLTHCFADATEGGILNTQTPSTELNYDFAVKNMNIPLISHEIGQYQVYPDFSEIDKYTGVLRAWNLEIFKKRLTEAGMANMDSAFQKASGAWSALCYKAEMEAALRTDGMAGFQLLDLQDFPGQGTALVGILDAFMDSKNVITPESWKQSCNDLVLLLEFPKYCWTRNETFHANIVVANYTNEKLISRLNWEISKSDGTLLAQGTTTPVQFKIGGLTSTGEINAKLSSLDRAEKLRIHLSLPDTEYTNDYPVWVYPSEKVPETPDGIVVAQTMDSELLNSLEEGAKVLWFPQTEDVQEHSYPGLFPPEFWNYGMFKNISERAKKPVSPGTLGILANPDHPLFNSFPSDFHTNWQWFSIIKASNSLILDQTPEDYFPIVQVIDNLERNHKLGIIFELKIGQGDLLVCMSQLNKIMDKPEAAQLYRSILNYMNSENFKPEYRISSEKLKELF